jgi:hypothetical protein
MPTKRHHLVIEAVAGKIYAVGGRTATGTNVRTNTLYDPGTDTWTAKKPMPTRRDHVRAAVIGDKIYVMGGFTSGYPSGVTGKVEVYDPDTDSWSTATAMPTARADFGMSTVGERIQAFGGVNGGGVQKVNEEYDPVTGSWRILAPMPSARRAIDGAEVAGVVYVPGGSPSVNDRCLRAHVSFAP